MFCPKCGKPIPEGGRFCGACGADVQAFRKESTPAAPRAARTPAAGKYRKKQKFPVKKLLLILLCLAVLAVAGFVLYQVFGMQTVYLPSRGTDTDASEKQTFKTEYDEQGKILSIETFTNDHTGRGSSDSYIKTYVYDDDGRIIAAEVELDDETFELEYRYDDKGHLKSIECGREKAKVECDKAGRITEISWEGGSAEYSYHKNGALKEAELDYGYATYDFAYDEQGNRIEEVIRVGGKKQSATYGVYDGNGNQTEMTMVSYSDGKTIAEIVVTYTYDEEGLPFQATVTVSMNDLAFSLHLVADSSGLRREFQVTDIEADEAILEAAGADAVGDLLNILEEELDGDPFMYMEYDAHGNVLESKLGVDGTESVKEYIPLRLPRSYRKSTGNDPIYFIPPIIG